MEREEKRIEVETYRSGKRREVKVRRGESRVERVQKWQEHREVKKTRDVRTDAAFARARPPLELK